MSTEDRGITAMLGIGAEEDFDMAGEKDPRSLPSMDRGCGGVC